MFSKRTVIIIGVIVLLALNIIILSVVDNRHFKSGRIVISMIAPFQEFFTRSIRFSRDIWYNYFYLASVAEENFALKKALKSAIEKNNENLETELSNNRLRELLNFKKSVDYKVIACEVISNDPSPFSKTVTIDKGMLDGLKIGLPVVVPEGIIGQIVEVANHYSKVLLITDVNSAVDALVQRNRIRGILKGDISGKCKLEYVLCKYEIKAGDIAIASGLDGLYPKGFRLGSISNFEKKKTGMFHEITVIPFVDFERLEEVMVLFNSTNNDSAAEQ